MYVKINIDGSINDVLRTRIFKGSHKVHELKLLAPYNQDFKVVFNIKLPDDSRYSDYMEFEQVIEGYGCWSFPINSTMTSFDGQIELSFDISKDDFILTTAKTHYVVEDSVLLGDGFEETALSFYNLLQLVNSKPSREEVEELVRNIPGGGNTEVWTEETQPDPEAFNTWFKPIRDEVQILEATMLSEIKYDVNNDPGVELQAESQPEPTEEIMPEQEPIAGEEIERIEVYISENLDEF